MRQEARRSGSASSVTERALARLEYKDRHYDEVMKATERTLRAEA